MLQNGETREADRPGRGRESKSHNAAGLGHHVAFAGDGHHRSVVIDVAEGGNGHAKGLRAADAITGANGIGAHQRRRPWQRLRLIEIHDAAAVAVPCGGHAGDEAGIPCGAVEGDRCG